MSVFKVNLSRVVDGSGNMDSTRVNGVSQQRTTYIMGPNRMMRELKDGQTFTDCNYWKKFDFIDVVTDDGSVWIDGTKSAVAAPLVFNPVSITYLETSKIAGEAGVALYSSGTTLTDSLTGLNIVNLFGTPATAVILENGDGSHDAKVTINGTATFTLYAGTTLTFNNSEIAVSKLEFSNPTSGVTLSKLQAIISVGAVATS